MNRISTHSIKRRNITSLQSSVQGFSLLEVMAGILLSLTFTGVAMQALVTSTVLKVRAQEEGESATWIQENIELIRHVADKLAYVDSRYNVELPPCRATSETVGYGDRLRDELNKVEFKGGNIANNTSSENQRVFNVVSSKGNRPYTVQRRTQVKTSDSYLGSNYIFNVLEVSYLVQDDQGKDISNSYVEIVPEVSLRCPL
jgi:type II secretory pathway pseudopilin PulG